MNYSRILCAALLCSTIAAVHASQAPLATDAKAVFTSIVDRVNNLHKDINTVNKNSFQQQLGLLRGNPAQWAQFCTQLEDASFAQSIDLDSLNKQLTEIATRASELKVVPKANSAFIQLRTKIASFANPQPAVTVSSTQVQPLVTTQTPVDATQQQPQQAASSTPQTPDATQTTQTAPDTTTTTPDVTTPGNTTTSATPEETDPSKITPQTEDPNAGKKTDDDKGGKKDDQNNTDPNKDAVKTAGFFKTYVFNAKTGAAASVVGLGTAGYYYYTTYMLPEEILTEEATPAA